MEEAEIKKKLAEMQKKLKPIEKGETTIKAEFEPGTVELKPTKPVIKKPTKKELEAAGPPPFEPAPEPVPATEGPCFNVEFKDLIMNLTPSYIGQNAAKNMLIEILGSVPDCPEKVKVAA